MSTLKLENYALSLLENEQIVREFLSRTSTGHSWTFELDLPKGEILFREPGTGRILFASPVKLIGTYEHDTEQFRFGWGNPAIPEDWQCVTGLGRMRVMARGAGLQVFDSTEPIALESRALAHGWALACASFLKAFFVFEAQQENKTHYLTVEYFPDAGLVERDIRLVQKVIQEGGQRFSLNLRQAVEAYLGKPSGAGGSSLSEETLHWRVGESTLKLRLSHSGQLLQLETSLPTTTSAPQPLLIENKSSWLARIFGKRR